VAKQKAEELAKSLEEKIGIRWSWARDSIKFDVPSGAAKGASGTVDVDASAVRVQIDLPFLLKSRQGDHRVQGEQEARRPPR
jgi:hypothetical protein